MQRWAIINNENKVQEILQQDPEGRYHPSLKIIEIPLYLIPFVDSQYTLTEEGLIPPSFDYLGNQMKTVVSNFSKHFENKGIFYKNLYFRLEDKIQIADYIATGTKHGAIENSNYSIKWKHGIDFHILNVSELKEIFDCFNEYKQELIEHEYAIYQYIDNCKTVNLEQFINNVDEQLKKSWPIPAFKIAKGEEK